MEKIITSINLLDAVLADLDKIPVEGFENQQKFVNCGTAIQTVVSTLAGFLHAAEAAQEEDCKELDDKDNIEMCECCPGIPLLGRLVGNTVVLTCENGCRTAEFEITSEARNRAVAKWNKEVANGG